MSATNTSWNIKYTLTIIVSLIMPINMHQSMTRNTTAVPKMQILTTVHTSRQHLCNVTTSFKILDECLTVIMEMDYHASKRKEMLQYMRYPDKDKANHNQTDDFCFPLSPQILNCELRKFDPECYEISNQNLLVLSSNLTTELGDYYLDSNKNAYLCLEYIRPSKDRPRCNYIQLDFGQYNLQEDGSLYINASNSTIQKPIYTMDNEIKVNACYPLSIHFLNCYIESARYLRPYLYEKKPGLKILYRELTTIYSVDEYCSRNNNGMDLIVCNPEITFGKLFLYYLYNAFRCMSIILVGITICHHLSVPKLTAHAKCLISYYLCMIAFFIVVMLPPIECYTHFVLSYLSSNAGVFWINIASYDIWRSLDFKIIPKRNGSNKGKSYRYLYYSIYGWGFPFLLLLTTLVLDKYYTRQDIPFLIADKGLTKNCWFRDKWFAFGLHFGIITILSLVNAVFFILTIYSIHKGSQGTKLVNKQRTRQM